MDPRQLRMLLIHSEEQRVQAFADHQTALRACRNYTPFRESQTEKKTKARLERGETIVACLEAEIGAEE